MRTLITLRAGAAALALCAALAPRPASAQLPRLTANVFVSGLSLPVDFVQDPTNPNVQFVVQQGGRIRPVVSGVLQTTDFLNLTGAISSGGERGLLGLAFALDYATSRRFFVNFTDPAGNTVIARFTRSVGNPLTADAASRFDLVWPTGNRFIVQDFANHNGGHIAFGPDGYLYIGMGDGGSGNDPNNRAQDPNSLLGKMLRIDVNVTDFDPQGYDIPPTNPFVGSTPVAALDEIWAFGLRNPWRWSFDDPSRGGTGAIVIGDVGQGAWEEIDYEPAARGGRNYGWRVREGAHNNVTSPPAAYLPLTEPIAEYSHSVGSSITGGFVYRGASLGPGFSGRYFYADFVVGRVWSLGLTINGATGEATAAGLVEHTADLGGSGTLGQISSFGVDAAGELYVVNYGGGTVVRLRTTCSLGLTGPQTFDPGGGAGVLTVTTQPGCAWTATSNNGFVTVPPGSSSSGTGIVNFFVAANTGAPNVQTAARAGSITVNGQLFALSQTGCTFARNPTGASISVAGGSASVAVTTPSACSWTAVSNTGFLSITAGSAGTGPGTVTYSATANPGAPNVANPARVGSLTVAGLAVTITQAGCTFALSSTAETFGVDGGAGAVGVSTGSVCPWTVTGLPAWTSTTSGGSGTGTGTWSFTVAANGTAALRTQTVQLAGLNLALTQLPSALKPIVPGQRTSITLNTSSDSRLTAIDAAAGRSYCAQVESDASATAASTPTVTIRRADFMTSVGGGTGRTACFVAPASETAIFEVTQTDNAPRPYRLAVAETTLWANWFFTGGTYSSYSMLRNTTASPITVTLTWRAPDGSSAGTQTVSLAGGGVLLTDARTQAPGAQSGSVEAAHAAAPDAIVGSQTTLAPVTGLSFDTVFSRRKGW